MFRPVAFGDLWNVHAPRALRRHRRQFDLHPAVAVGPEEVLIGLALLTLMAARAAAPPPEAVLINYADVFRTDDYPVEALRKSESGTVAVRVSVSAAGLPTGCDMVNPSSSASLNRATCALAMARARFEPVRDRHGQATASSDLIRVRWVVPNAELVPITDQYYKVIYPLDSKGRLGSCKFEAVPPILNFNACERVSTSFGAVIAEISAVAAKAGMTQMSAIEGQFAGANQDALIAALTAGSQMFSGHVVVLSIDPSGKETSCTVWRNGPSDAAVERVCGFYRKERYWPLPVTEKNSGPRYLTRFAVLAFSRKNSPPTEAQPPLKDAGMASLFSQDDYPVSALRNSQEGTVAVVLDVTPEGRVGACHVEQSSGVAALDEGTCSLLQRRARFTPALDQFGHAIADHYRQRVRWALPRSAYKSSIQGATIGFSHNGNSATCEFDETNGSDEAPDCDKLTAMVRIMWPESGYRGSMAGRTVRIEHRADIDMASPLVSLSQGPWSRMWREVAQYRVRPDGRLVECHIIGDNEARDPLDLCGGPIDGPFDVDPAGLFRSVRTTVSLSLPNR